MERCLESQHRPGEWTEDEDSKLRDAVQRHGFKNLVTIAELVPGRTHKQCCNRWRVVLDPNIDRASGRKSWTVFEDRKLKDAVQTHGSKNWKTIAALIPDRTKLQCRSRWHGALNHNIDRAPPGRSGKWTEDEDSKLKDVAQTPGSKNWKTIAALIPDRTKAQCRSRWDDVLKHNIDRAKGRTGKWTEDEDIKLKDAVQTHSDNDWAAVAALVPGQTRKQCHELSVALWSRVD
jgi:hypothetical protein